MATTTIRIEDEMMKQLKTLAKQLGVSFSTLTLAAYQHVLRNRKIELSVPEYRLNPEYEEKLLNDPEYKETVFVAETPEDIDRFFATL